MKKSHCLYFAAAFLGAASLVTSRAADLTWQGSSANWNTSATNWTSSSGNTAFANGDNVFFTDSGLALNPNAQTAVTSVGNMSFLNTTGTYVLTNAATFPIANFSKSGAGTVSLTSNNAPTISGTATLSAGTMNFRSSFTAATINIAGNFAIGSAFESNITLNGALTGSSELTVAPSFSATPKHAIFNGDNSGFSGTIKATTDGFLDFNSASLNLQNAAISLSGSTSLQGAATNATFRIGQINSGANNQVAKGATGASTLTFEIGALNTASSIAGQIVDKGTDSGGSVIGTGNVGLTKIGDGSLTLTGANTYTAPTTVSAGTLLLGNGTSGSITSAATVNAGALYGNLTSGNVTTAAVTVGNGSGSADAAFGAGENIIGRFASSSSLSLASDANFVFDLNSFAKTTDTVTFGGAVALNGLFTLNDLNNGAGNWSVSDSFTVVSGNSRVGEFNNLANGETISKNGITYQAGYTGTAFTLTVTATAVPEPTSLLTASCLSLLLFFRRRRFV